MIDAFAPFGFELFQNQVHKKDFLSSNHTDSDEPCQLATHPSSNQSLQSLEQREKPRPIDTTKPQYALECISMHTHIIQLDIAWEDKAANHARVLELIESAPINPADLIVLPELFDVGFTLNAQIATDAPGTTRAFLQQLADDTRCTIHGSRALPDPDTGKLHNVATITAPNQASPICEYAKLHPFSFGRETESYAAGNEIKLYQWISEQTLSICPAICYDLRFPELFRHSIHQGAQAFVLGANWPVARIAHWRALCIARAIENQAFVIAANRTGDDPHLTYPGNSMVVGPQGEILAELGNEEAVLSIEIDPQCVIDWRTTFPVLNDIKLI